MKRMPGSFCRRDSLLFTECFDSLYRWRGVGFGAEMGISTQKLHCRGPFALAELTSSKYEIVGTGQVR